MVSRQALHGHAACTTIITPQRIHRRSSSVRMCESIYILQYATMYHTHCEVLTVFNGASCTNVRAFNLYMYIIHFRNTRAATAPVERTKKLRL